MLKNNKKIGTALITGGAQRIGKEIAIKLANLGYNIVISYNNSKQEAEELKNNIISEYQVNCEIFACDLLDVSQTKNLADFMVQNFDDWNLLINNASIFDKSKLLENKESELFDNFNIHLFSPLILSKEFAINVGEKNIQNAQVINIVDKAITRNKTEYFYYLLSKKSLANLTKMLATQLSPAIRVNAVAPGFIMLPKNSDLDGDTLIDKIPLKKQGSLKNITHAVQFLIENDFVCGEILFVDGASSLV